MKKVIIPIITGVTILGGALGAAYCPKKTECAYSLEKVNEKGVMVTSKSGMLIDADSGKVLFSKDENKRLPIASVVKVMTLLLAFEAESRGEFNLDEDIVVSSEAAGMGGSQVFLEANGVYKASDLVKAIIIASGNDASVAIAERLAGSETEFVNKMNERAKELGMTNTNFENATGLPSPSGYSTAKDVSLMFNELIKYPKYFDYTRIWLDELTHEGGRKSELANTNKLVRFYNGCDAGKTGSTSEAGFCLATTAKRGDLRLVSVILGGETGKIRFKEASDLLNYGFGSFTNKQIVNSSDVIEIKVNKAKEKVSLASAKHGFNFLTKKGDKTDVKTNVNIMENISAPLKKGDKVGEIIVTESGNVIKTIDIVLTKDVQEKNYVDYLKDIIKNR